MAPVPPLARLCCPRRAVVALTFAALWHTVPTRADAPRPAPTDKRVFSANRRFYVFMDARRSHTTAFQVAPRGAPVKLWEMPGWFEVAALADDGEHLVTGNPGSNLLNPNPPRTEVMLSFYRKGQLIRSVTLGEILPDLKVLRPTVSHVYWGHYLGLDAQNHYLIKTVDGRTLAFDVRTGLLARPAAAAPPPPAKGGQDPPPHTTGTAAATRR